MPLGKAIGYDVLKMVAGKGWSITRMVDYARSLGGGYSNEDMREDARKFTGRFKYEYDTRRLAFNEVTPQWLMVETKLADPKAKYRVFGEITLYEEETDTYLNKTASFYTDSLAKEGDWYGEFFNSYEWKYEYEDLELIDFQHIATEHNIGKPY